MTIICESFLLHLYTLAKQIKGTLDCHGITQSGTHHWYRFIQLGSVSHSECVTPVSVANKNDNRCTGKKKQQQENPQKEWFCRCWPQNWYYRLCMRRNRKSYIITLSRVLAHVSDYTVKNRLHQSGMRSSYTLVGLLLASQHSPLSTITD